MKVTGSISQNTGRAPVRAIVPAVAKKVNGEVITSSPAPMLSAVEYEDDPFAEASDFDLVPVG